MAGHDWKGWSNHSLFHVLGSCSLPQLRTSPSQLPGKICVTLPKEKKTSESSILIDARPIMHTQQPFATLLFISIICCLRWQLYWFLDDTAPYLSVLRKKDFWGKKDRWEQAVSLLLFYLACTHSSHLQHYFFISIICCLRWQLNWFLDDTAPYLSILRKKDFRGKKDRWEQAVVLLPVWQLWTGFWTTRLHISPFCESRILEGEKTGENRLSLLLFCCILLCTHHPQKQQIHHTRQGEHHQIIMTNCGEWVSIASYSFVFTGVWPTQWCGWICSHPLQSFKFADTNSNPDRVYSETEIWFIFLNKRLNFHFVMPNYSCTKEKMQ